MTNHKHLPALISFLDETHCSVNCQLMNLQCCSALIYNRDSWERLKKDGNHYLRTDYCREVAFEIDPETRVKRSCETCCYQHEDSLVKLCGTCDPETLSNWHE